MSTDRAIPPFYVKTGYHYWQIIDRATGEAVANFSARGQGDKAARTKASLACRSMNAGRGFTS